MTPGRVLLSLLGLLLVGSLLVASPASAAPPDLVVSAPATAYAGTTVTISGTTSDTGAPIRLDRRDRVGTWVQVATTAPAADGSFALRVTADPGTQRFRVVQATGGGTAVRELAVTGNAAPSRVALGGATRVADGNTATLQVRWTTSDGRPVTGTTQLWARRRSSTTWEHRSTFTVRAGAAAVRVRPRVDVVYRVRVGATPYARTAWSATRTIDNIPPGYVFRRPAKAPAPRIRLRAQPRATKAGAAVTVSRISDSVWRSMTGRTWHRGCPVGRSSLRLVRTNYYAYDGYRRRGEIVVHKSVAKATKRVFQDLHAAKAPIRSLYRVDRFGWSRRLRGGNDLKSMAAGNSSGFNCRGVVGRPSTRSPHSTGRSLDINPWENPYRSAWGILPNRTWDARRSPSRVVYRSRSHTVVRIMARHGFWWMGRSDWQHFQYSGRGARTLPPPATFLD
ncbi:M15 family metallopeptidase [Mumia zhuanghuii]|uniref:M15 family metallopeptidase n=2 Tax=Mumia TaxID=1546255 RepID=A0ABW1QND2_9ACTN|nr:MULTISPECIES: M15 family metallopeptidase [Mumia]KAA1423338.1 M15 family metallopeptidase [Mumia zhuanghuii]